MRTYDWGDVDTLQREIIALGIFEVDEFLRVIRGRDLLSTDEVINVLLDIRQVLNTKQVQ